jgi:hypothetical protein
MNVNFGVPMKKLTTMAAAALTMTALTVAGGAPPAAAMAHGHGRTAESSCVPVRTVTEFYEAGRKASFPLTVPDSGCTTISVSHIRDTADSADRCQTFLVGFFPSDGSGPTYTEPVNACAVPSSTRTVLATQVPDGAVYRILYNIDYLQPTSQVVRYKVWH